LALFRADDRLDVRAAADRPFEADFRAALRPPAFALPRDRVDFARRTAAVARRLTFFTALDTARRGLAVFSTAEVAAFAAAVAAELAAPVAACAASTTVRVAVPIVLPTASAACVARPSSRSSSRNESSAIASPCRARSLRPRHDDECISAVCAAHVNRRSSKRSTQCRVKCDGPRAYIPPASARHPGDPRPHTYA